MAFLPSLRRLAATWKLPFILVASPPLRETSSLVASADSEGLSPNFIAQQMRIPVPLGTQNRRDSSDGRVTHAKQKELKRRGFNAIVRWCAYHQEAKHVGSDGDTSGRDGSEAKYMDAAALQWVNESLETFSCGQSLVVLSFLCDVVQRQTRQPQSKGEEGSGPSSSPADVSGLIAQLTHSIALLAARAVINEQLELQPFLILLSAVYGLTRITDGNPLHLPPLVLESLTPPSVLWLALLHQLRAFYSVGGDSSESLDNNMNVEALLTVLLLFDESRCKMFFAPNDYKMLDGLTRRLVRLLQPALKTSRAARLRSAQDVKSAEEEGGGQGEGEHFDTAMTEGLLVKSPEHKSDRSKKGQLSLGSEQGEEEERTEHSSLTEAVSDGALVGMRRRISVRDCCSIVKRAHVSSPQYRLDLLEYFLCVLLDPATMTRAELQQLPALLDAPGLVWDVKTLELVEYVLRKREIRELDLLVPLLPFMRAVHPVMAFIKSEVAKEAEGCSASVDADLALCILLTVGSPLPWSSRLFLIRRCLQKSPEMLCAVDAALEEGGQSGSIRGSAPETVECNGAPPRTTKVSLSPDLCMLLSFLFRYELPRVPFPVPHGVENTQCYEAYTEALLVAGAVVRSIDWPGCVPDQLVQKRADEFRGVHLSHFTMAFSALTAYLQSHGTYHFLTAADEMEDRALLNTLVLPLLRHTAEGQTRRRVQRLLRLVLTRLKSVEYQRQLTYRAVQYDGFASYAQLFFFAYYYAAKATELRVFPPALIDFIFRQRTLMPRSLPRWVSSQVNLSKTYSTVLVRVVRYVIASSLLTATNSEAATRRAYVAGWFAHYFNIVSTPTRQGDFASGGVVAAKGLATAERGDDDDNGDGVHGGSAAPLECNFAEEVTMAASPSAEARDVTAEEGGDETAEPVEHASDPHHRSGSGTVHKRESMKGTGEGEDLNGNVDGAEEEAEAEDDEAESPFPAARTPTLDEAFTSSVTDDDLEAVLTVMLQVGCKASPRTLAFVAQRLRENTLIGKTAPIEAALQETAGGADRAGEEIAAPRPWSEEPDAPTRMSFGEAAPPLALPCLPLPAHFVFAVRADSALTFPMTASYLTTLLTTCDLAIFHHVLSAFFLALKRRRSVVVLAHDLHIAAIAMDVLQQRLASYAREHVAEAHNNEEQTDVTSQLLSRTAFKSLVHLLFHFIQLPPRTSYFRSLVELLHMQSGNDAGDRETATTTPAFLHVAKVDDAEEQSDLSCGDDDSSSDACNSNNSNTDSGRGDARDDASMLRQLRSTHTRAAFNVLQVAAFIASPQLKEFTLTHLQRLALFFPDAAAFVFLQVRPQLSGFTQRELLQAATQYPAGVTDILAELRKVDMRVSIDLGEFVPLSKKLPMRINEAVVEAHVPFMTMAWVTRTLSALAVRHEEMPLSLQQALFARVEAVADTATESDKSLLLLVLQGYLLFGATSPSTAAGDNGSNTALGEDGQGTCPRCKGDADDRGDEQTWKENLLLKAQSATEGYCAALTPAAQRERVDLVRHCCDQLLSLERIATLEELRYFLASYPPSLHQLRERGVVAVVEQKLLPAMLTASPVRWAELDDLVRLLAEHRVLLPETVRKIADGLFTAAQLDLLQRDALVNGLSDTAAVLTGCLRIAITCAEAVRSASRESAEALPLLPTVDAVLRVFDAPQDWLAALTTFMASHPSRVGNQGPALSLAPSGCAASSYGGLTVVARHLCTLLLSETEDLNPSEFARLMQCVGRLKAWDLVMPTTDATRAATAAGGEGAPDFPHVFHAVLKRADAHSRCVLLKAVATDARVFRCFETAVFRVILDDVALLSPEDLEAVLTAALQVSDEAVVEPLLDAVGTRLLPMIDQCRRSTLVRLLQCHFVFHVNDKTVVLAALGALDRQSSVEVKLDATQVIIVLQAIAALPLAEMPERLMVLSFQRLEKLVQVLTPLQLYQVGQLILDLEMGYLPCIHTLITFILESRDGPRGHRDFQTMTETICDVYDVEVAASLRATRLRKRRHKERIRDFYAAQRRASLQVLL